MGCWNVKAFYDSAAEKYLPSVNGVAVLPYAHITNREVDAVLVAIGDNTIRARMIEELSSYGLPLITVIHPSASVARTATIGEGVFIARGSHICDGAHIGTGVIVNTGAIVEHQCYMHYCSHIGPGARLAGHCIVKDRAFLGLGATVIQGLTIGTDAIVGAGSVVLNDIPDGTKWVGSPAREIK
jgi:sugar O-acyltransferase (sialic acid O-acetyltransferase NeuD family)